jgi:hypothetical protein
VRASASRSRNSAASNCDPQSAYAHGCHDKASAQRKRPRRGRGLLWLYRAVREGAPQPTDLPIKRADALRVPPRVFGNRSSRSSISAPAVAQRQPRDHRQWSGLCGQDFLPSRHRARGRRQKSSGLRDLDRRTSKPALVSELRGLPDKNRGGLSAASPCSLGGGSLRLQPSVLRVSCGHSGGEPGSRAHGRSGHRPAIILSESYNTAVHSV